MTGATAPHARGTIATAHGDIRDAGVHAGRHRRNREGNDRLTRCAPPAPSIVLAGTPITSCCGRAPTGLLRLGGLHRFMDWPEQRPILTDSGGFQVMSLAKLRKLDADGVTFQSHIDGSSHRLTPARSVAIQHKLDATITMALDECTPFPATPDEARRSMELSMRWAALSRAGFVERPGYGLFGIVQGSIYPELRAESAASLCGVGFDGYAIGGLAVGEGQAVMFDVLDATVPLLPADRPRYLMGVGTHGRPGRGGAAWDRYVRLRDAYARRPHGTGLYLTGDFPTFCNARFADDAAPLDPNCPCPGLRGDIRAPICIICSRPRKCWGRCC